MRAPIGIRIRNYRKIKGLSQVKLAKAIPISASYLNLIEANKRDVGGTLLHKIAAELGVELHDLTGDSETRLINELREAFADPLLAPLKLGAEDAHIMVAQLPELARALHICFRGFLDASASANALSNRLKSDPLFSELLHQMLSQITAIRSTTEILRDVPDIPKPQLNNFYASVFEESRALSDVTQSLIAQFDTEAEQHHSFTPMREVNDLIIGENNYFPSLEQAAAELRATLNLHHPISLSDLHRLAQNSLTPTSNTRMPIASMRFQLASQIVSQHCADLLAFLVKDQRLTSDIARSVAKTAVTSYCASALLFPYDSFLATAKDLSYDVDLLAQHYDASFEQIAHRLVTLRNPDNPGIPFGFLRTDPSGYLTKQFPLPGLLMPNAGHACPLWVIYQSLQNPNQVVQQIASFSDNSRYLFIAKTTKKPTTDFNQTPVQSAVMLVCDLLHADKIVYSQLLKLDQPQLDIPVGPSCNLCVRKSCAHRNTPMASSAKS